MDESSREERWVFVLVDHPEKSPGILGFHDPERDLRFIPAFREKSEALEGAGNLPRISRGEAEVQAILFEDLSVYAARGGFVIYFLSGDGAILEKVDPASR